VERLLRDFTIVQEDEEEVPEEVLEERGRALAIRAQNELRTDGWEVLYFRDGQAHRVHPPGSWPDDTWERDLLGYGLPDLRKLPKQGA
jgi:hypothetical protein